MDNNDFIQNELGNGFHLSVQALGRCDYQAPTL